MRKFFLTLLTCTLLCGLSLGAAKSKIRIFVAGDSTAQTYSEENSIQRGWGQRLQLFFDEDKVEVVNRSIGARSSGTFISEGRWDGIMRDIQPGDFVIVQFGHNDTSPNMARYVAPDAYKANFAKFANNARAKGATPIFCTSIAMRTWKNGELVVERPHFAEYIQYVRDVAAELNVILIDMHKETLDLIRSLGDEGSKELYYHVKVGDHPSIQADKQDDTHLREKGAMAYAKIIADNIRSQKIKPLNKCLKKVKYKKK